MNEAIANVKAYFINHPEKIAIRWEEYQAELNDRAKNEILRSQRLQQYQTQTNCNSATSDNEVPCFQNDRQQNNSYQDNLPNETIVLQDQDGRQVKINDYTGCHQQLEREKPNPKVSQMLGDAIAFLKSKGGKS